jgi:hypothetical protein
MTHQFDEFSKSLAEKSVSRRESLGLFGAALAGALLSPLGVRTAWAGGPDPCRVFCNQCPRSQRSRCLAACRACNNESGYLCTDCWTYACCGSGETCCGNTCHDLDSDFDHCGACYDYCDESGPYENGACINGDCEYWCVQGAVACDGGCSLLDQDRYNCGACGNVCPDATPYCGGGQCMECPGAQSNCGGECVYLNSDREHCGACFNACGGGFNCVDGVCE